jgi:hypothetical protein
VNIHTNSTSTTSGSRRRFSRTALLATVGGGAVLVAVAGAGLWARSSNSESSSQAVANVHAPLNTTGAPASIADTSPVTTQAHQNHDLVYVYIVGSEAEAAELRNAATGVPGWPSQVVVASSRAEADFEATAFGAQNDTRAAAGQPQVRALVVGQLAAAQ